MGVNDAKRMQWQPVQVLKVNLQVKRTVYLEAWKIDFFA